jgi:F420-dependent oxidoreductase-like protein
MRFGFGTPQQRTTWNWMLDVWRLADDAEVLETGWTFDHLYPLFGDSTQDCMEGWITLTALLQATTRVRGAVLVTGMVYRHPGVLANMATTLDIVSNGRLEFGLGAGWNEEECDAFGIELGTMTERFDRFEEGLAVIESLMTNDRTTFHGKYYELNDAMNNPKPVQRPVPVCIGGRGQKRTMPMVARYAQHWNFGPPDPAEFTACRDALAKACDKIGRDIGEITISSLNSWSNADALNRHLDTFEPLGTNMVIVSIPPTMPAEVILEVAAAAEARR